MSDFIPVYDLESLNEVQRQDYVRNVCKHLGVPPELNLVMLGYIDENDDGPRRLVAWVKRGATEIVRHNRGINVTEIRKERDGGSIIFFVTGKDKDGRQEMSVGSKWVDGLTGKDYDDAVMTAQTRAIRRMTLQFLGAGVLDESEVNHRVSPVELKNTTPIPQTPQPVVGISLAPATDVTKVEPKQDNKVSDEQLAKFSAEQEQLRKDAIEELNRQHKEREAKKQEPVAEPVAEPAPAEVAQEPVAKRKYIRKAKVDLGPSAEIAAAAVTTPAPAQKPEPEPTTSAVVPAQPPVAVASPASAPAVPGKSRLTPEQVKPYRQRLFKLVNDQLEPAGFTPKENMGNADKMRQLATIMFSDVSGMNELSVEQWEKYLTTLEQKVANEGPQKTIEYIEGTIGL